MKIKLLYSRMIWLHPSPSFTLLAKQQVMENIYLLAVTQSEERLREKKVRYHCRFCKLEDGGREARGQAK
jgi:hypothetical protein